MAAAVQKIPLINSGRNVSFVFVNQRNRVSARIILQKSTLLTRIDIIEAGEAKYTKT